jgi:hypothetical protein
MRHLISGLVAAAAVMFAAPAMACGFGGCSPCGFESSCAPVVAPPVYSGCGGCGGGWGYERLAEPATQYYYVNQGPTYTGPGAFAPYPTYREDAVLTPGLGGYGYGYGGGYGAGYGYRAAAVAAPYARPYYRPYRWGYGPRVGYLPRTHYGYGPRYGYGHRYGYAHRSMPYYYGHRVLRRYY